VQSFALGGGNLGESFYAIEVSPSGTGALAIGDRLKRSTDGGRQWVDSGPSATTVSWASDTTVLAAGGLFGELFRSSDGGGSWSTVFNDFTRNFNAIGMASAATDVALGRASGSSPGSGGFKARLADRPARGVLALRRRRCRSCKFMHGALFASHGRTWPSVEAAAGLVS
jgi:hypothetical protein